jgi:hypothetical protein
MFNDKKQILTRLQQIVVISLFFWFSLSHFPFFSFQPPHICAQHHSSWLRFPFFSPPFLFFKFYFLPYHIVHHCFSFSSFFFLPLTLFSSSYSLLLICTTLLFTVSSTFSLIPFSMTLLLFFLSFPRSFL